MLRLPRRVEQQSKESLFECCAAAATFTAICGPVYIRSCFSMVLTIPIQLKETMEAPGDPASSKKRKAATLESTHGAPAPESLDSGDGEDAGGGVDRISALPDDILGDIISLLPNDQGARTQILAPQWRHL
jgi:hypothetical protein